MSDFLVIPLIIVAPGDDKLLNPWPQYRWLAVLYYRGQSDSIAISPCLALRWHYPVAWC